MALPDVPELADLLRPFLDDPAHAGILTDFDGTLAPVVPDPAASRPLEGAVRTLHRLTRHYRRVAVVSGRPASFLSKRLHLEHDEVLGGEAVGEGLIVSGLYGLETAMGGDITAHPDCDRWRPVVRRIADEAEEQLPGVLVERKGLSVTLHFRTRPDMAEAVRRWAEEAAARSGLKVHPARMSDELVPPIPVDKGRVVRQLVEGLKAVVFLGDDVGDLPAFDALDELRAHGVYTLKVVVASTEVARALRNTADVMVDGPEGALAVLTRLLPQPAARS
jgi:trehalose 6-phosphate phosphatase